MDASNMTLDEIIKKKKIGIPQSNRFRPSTSTNANSTRDSNRKGGRIDRSPVRITDARNKIIQHNRLKIRDARDKIVQLSRRKDDARKRLLQKGKVLLNGKKRASSSSSSQSSHIMGHQLRRRHQSKSLPLSIPLVSTSPLKHRSVQVNRRRILQSPVDTKYSVHNDLMDIVDDYDDIDMNEYDRLLMIRTDDLPYTPTLRRTVKNDIMYTSSMPPLPRFGNEDYSNRRLRSPSPQQVRMQQLKPMYREHEQLGNRWMETPDMESDPFDCYEIPIGRPSDVSEPRNISRQIQDVSRENPYYINDTPERKGILRRPLPPAPLKRFSPDENSQLSHEMRIRLERTPDSTSSMGIFSNPYTTKPSIGGTKNISGTGNAAQKPRPPVQQATPLSSNGYRIVVSNLHPSVTQGDIKELFEDIGELLEARLVRPGVAEVIFSTMKDAELAVDSYHNRQLDGQPMKCLLVNPRASSKPTAPAIKSSASARSSNAATTNSSMEIDIDALHKVLFRKNYYKTYMKD